MNPRQAYDEASKAWSAACAEYAGAQSAYRARTIDDTAFLKVRRLRDTALQALERATVELDDYEARLASIVDRSTSRAQWPARAKIGRWD